MDDVGVQVHTSSDDPTPTVAAAIQRMARRLLAEAEGLGDGANAAILADAPVLSADPALIAQTRASTMANVERWLRAQIARPGTAVRGDVPPEALDLARDLVRRGIEREALQIGYRQGQNVAWREWMRCAREEDLDADELIAVLDLGSRSLFGYVDEVLAAIGAQMEREAEELLGGALARRRETVLLVLDGAPITAARASERLGYALDRTHTALVLWAPPGAVEPGALERTAGALARAAGARRPFTVPAGSSALWAWMSGAVDEVALPAAIDNAPAEVRAAVGTSAPGVTGFRDSHREARDAQRLAMRDAAGPRLVAYADVRAVALASLDEERAAAFVAATLGGLADADAELRETVRVYLAEDRSAPRVAALLHTHRNTILKRIARAETLLPQPLAGRALEVRLALELQRWGAPLQPVSRR